MTSMNASLTIYNSQYFTSSQWYLYVGDSILPHGVQGKPWLLRSNLICSFVEFDLDLFVIMFCVAYASIVSLY